MPARPGRSLGFRAFPGGAVQLWDDGLFAVIDRAGRTTQAINVHQRPVRDVAVSPDGRWAVTAGAGSEVFRWGIDPASGLWYGPELLPGHTDDVVGVEVDASGRHLASVSLDRTAIFWDMSAPTAPAVPGADAARRLDAACAIAGRDLTPAEWRRFLPDRPWQPTCTDLP
jgi:WD40 repeat protein